LPDPVRKDIRTGQAHPASFAGPITLAIDPARDIYVGDGTSFRKITPAGVVTTLPSFFTSGLHFSVIGVDNHYNLYESDRNSVIRIDSTGN
jgi:hypothetical protein